MQGTCCPSHVTPPQPCTRTCDQDWCINADFSLLPLVFYHNITSVLLVRAVGAKGSVVSAAGEPGNPEELLRKAVKSALQAAVDQQISSLAMPLLCSGIFGCPVPRAAELVVPAVIDFLEQMAPENQDCLKVGNVQVAPCRTGCAVQAMPGWC